MRDPTGPETTLLEATVGAQRALLRARRPADVVAALERTVHVLGGSVVARDTAGDEVLQLDLSLGVREAMLPWAPPGEEARERIQRVLPQLIEDARRLVHLLWAREDLEEPSLRDELTGALHADATARLAARGLAEDTLVGFSLVGTGRIDEIHGQARVDVLLRQLAGFVRSELDVDERLGRLSEPSLVVLLPHARAGRVGDLVARVTARWDRQRALPVALRTGSLPIGADADAAIATLAADLRVDDDAADAADAAGASWWGRQRDRSS